MSWPHIAYVNSNLRCALRLVYVAWAQLAFLHGYCFLHHRLLLSHALLDGCWVLRCDFPSMVWWRFECTWLTRWLKPRAWRATPGCQSSRLHLRARMTREITYLNQMLTLIFDDVFFTIFVDEIWNITPFHRMFRQEFWWFTISLSPINKQFWSTQISAYPNNHSISNKHWIFC